MAGHSLLNPICLSLSVPTVVITEPIDLAGVDLLKTNDVEVISLPPGSREDDLQTVIARADALITRGGMKVTRELMASSPRLRAIGVHGIGCDHVDLTAARELGKTVLNTPDALTVTVAEMAVAMLLAATRRVAAADRAVRVGEWSRKYRDLVGVELAGKIVGLVGMGRIGAETARRLRSFDVTLLYWSRTRHSQLEAELGIAYSELTDLLARSDVVSLHVPGTKETHHLIGEAELATMKPTAILVNTARGRVVDEVALVEALRHGRIAGAALDVFETEPLPRDSPLTSMENVVLAPHLSASSKEAMQRMAKQVAQGILDVISGKEPANRVV